MGVFGGLAIFLLGMEQMTTALESVAGAGMSKVLGRLTKHRFSAAITPAAYQTNLMVYGPGEDSFMDFVKMGVPLTLLVGAVTLLLTPRVFAF